MEEADEAAGADGEHSGAVAAVALRPNNKQPATYSDNWVRRTEAVCFRFGNRSNTH